MLVHALAACRRHNIAFTFAQIRLARAVYVKMMLREPTKLTAREKEDAVRDGCELLLEKSEEETQSLAAAAAPIHSVSRTPPNLFWPKAFYFCMYGASWSSLARRPHLSSQQLLHLSNDDDRPCSIRTSQAPPPASIPSSLFSSTSTA